MIIIRKIDELRFTVEKTAKRRKNKLMRGSRKEFYFKIIAKKKKTETSAEISVLATSSESSNLHSIIIRMVLVGKKASKIR